MFSEIKYTKEILRCMSYTYHEYRYSFHEHILVRSHLLDILHECSRLHHDTPRRMTELKNK